MSSSFPRPVSSVAKRATYNKMCDQSQILSDIAQKLGIQLSQGDVNQLVQGIAAGGSAGMALALSLANSIADANYQMTPQLMLDLTNTLNQGSNGSLHFSHLVQLKLSGRKPLR